MRKTQTRLVAVLLGEASQRVDDIDRPSNQDLHALPHLDQVSIAYDILAGRAEVNDRPSFGRDVTVGVDVRHHLVAKFSLILGYLLKIYVIDVAHHLPDLSVGDRQTKRFLRLGQRQPQPSPSGKLPLSAE